MMPPVVVGAMPMRRDPSPSPHRGATAHAIWYLLPACCICGTQTVAVCGAGVGAATGAGTEMDVAACVALAAVAAAAAFAALRFDEEGGALGLGCHALERFGRRAEPPFGAPLAGEPMAPER